MRKSRKSDNVYVSPAINGETEVSLELIVAKFFSEDLTRPTPICRVYACMVFLNVHVMYSVLVSTMYEVSPS